MLLSNIFSIVGALLTSGLLYLVVFYLKGKLIKGENITINNQTSSPAQIKNVIKFLNLLNVVILVSGIFIPLVTGCPLIGGGSRSIGFTFFRREYCFYEGLIPQAYQDPLMWLLIVIMTFYIAKLLSDIRKSKKEVIK